MSLVSLLKTEIIILTALPSYTETAWPLQQLWTRREYLGKGRCNIRNVQTKVNVQELLK